MLPLRVSGLPCPLPSLLTVFSGSKDSVVRSIQGLTLTCSTEVTRRQVADAVCLGKKKTHGVWLCTFLCWKGWCNCLSFFQKAGLKISKEIQERNLLFAPVGIMLTRLMTSIGDYYKAFSLNVYFSKPQE